MSSKIRRIGVLTGGGDCPGLNAVIRAVTKSALNQYKLEVIGIEDGFLGLIQNKMRPLHWNDVSNILTLGGTILGTSNAANPKRYAVKRGGKTEFIDVTDRVSEHANNAGLALGNTPAFPGSHISTTRRPRSHQLPPRTG